MTTREVFRKPAPGKKQVDGDIISSELGWNEDIDTDQFSSETVVQVPPFSMPVTSINSLYFLQFHLTRQTRE